MESQWKNPFLLELKVADIISRQWKHGVQFNARKAKWVIHTLTERVIDIDKVLVPLLPKMLNKGTEYKKPFKINGDFMKYPGEYAQSAGWTRQMVGGPFTALWYTPFDPGKTAKVKSLMLDLGWIPTEWNEKKQPFQVFRHRKRLEKVSYERFIETHEDGEFLDTLVTEYIQKHFVNKSKGYMKAILIALGFDLKRVPTFSLIKKKLLLKQFWPNTPKITEDSFDTLEEDEGRVLTLLKDRMKLCHRRSFLEGLVIEYTDRGDGKLSAEANPCATPTARMRHKIVVNVPAARAMLGKECRSMFRGDYNGKSDHKIVKLLTPEMLASGLWRRKPGTNIKQELKGDKWKDAGYCAWYIPRGYDAFVGGDGAGLELRMLTHYLVAVSKMLLKEAEDNKDKAGVAKYTAALESARQYREVLLNGDIHSHNQKLAGLPTRDAAKSFVYSFLYGAGNVKLGSQLGGGAEEGAKIRETFLRECPCIPVLIEWVQAHAQKHGWVPAIDGRKLVMRIDQSTGEVMTHKALNTMLQAAGSIVMKYSMCFLDNWIKRDKINCHQVIMMHKIRCASKIM